MDVIQALLAQWYVVLRQLSAALMVTVGDLADRVELLLVTVSLFGLVGAVSSCQLTTNLSPRGTAAPPPGSRPASRPVLVVATPWSRAAAVQRRPSSSSATGSSSERGELHQSRELAYATVKTVMSRLAEKGYLRRQATERAHRFEPVLDRATFLCQVSEEVLEGLFVDFGEPIRAHLVDALKARDLPGLERLDAWVREGKRRRR